MVAQRNCDICFTSISILFLPVKYSLPIWNEGTNWIANFLNKSMKVIFSLHYLVKKVLWESCPRHECGEKYRSKIETFYP